MLSLQKLVEKLARFENASHIGTFWVFNEWIPLILCDSSLGVPRLQIQFVHSSLAHLCVGFEVQHGSHACSFHLLNVNFEKWISSKNYFMVYVLLLQICEKESLQECTVGLFNYSVDNVHVVADLLVGLIDVGDAGEAVWVLNAENTLRKSLNQLPKVILIPFRLDVSVLI